MSHKVLLADDSLTIQKVIKITLASEPFDIQECGSTADLMNGLSSNPEIVFLDYSLDDNLDGYELARQVKEKNPSVKILMLYGTFDTVDYEALNEAGVEANIIKPFDSNKFISICNDLVDGKSASAPATHSRDDLPGGGIVTESDDELDQWDQENTAPLEEELPPVMDDASEEESIEELEAELEEAEAELDEIESTEELEEIEEEIEEIEAELEAQDASDLDDAAADWGADEELPPVIEEDSEDDSSTEESDEEEEIAASAEGEERDLSHLPKEPPADGFKNDELEFPEIDSIIQFYDNDSDQLMDPKSGAVAPPKKESHLSVVEDTGSEDAFDDEDPFAEDIDENEELPPVMEVSSEEEAVEEVEVETASLPDSDDLEYPDMSASSDDVSMPSDDDLEYPDMSSVSADEPAEEERKPMFQSMDDLTPEAPREIEIDDLSFDTGEGTNSKEELDNIAMQIEDEEDEDDLWSIDEGISAQPQTSVPKPESEVAASNDGEVEVSENDEVDEDAKRLTKETLDSANISAMKIDTEAISREVQSDIEARIASLVQEIVEQKVREYCASQVDRVAWEVIPDLAENIVKTELAKISAHVMDER